MHSGHKSILIKDLFNGETEELEETFHPLLVEAMKSEQNID